MQQRFSKLVRRTGAVIVCAVLAASSAAFASAQEPELPFAGFAALSPEDQERALEGKSFDELFHAGAKLAENRKLLDAQALLKSLLGADRTESEYIQALTKYFEAVFPGGVSSSLDYESLFDGVQQTLDDALAKWPNSWRVKTRVAELLNYFPELGHMKGDKFVYTYHRMEPEDLLSCSERLRVRKLQLYAEALPLVREEIARANDPGVKAANDDRSTQIDASAYYLSFAHRFQSFNTRDYRRQLALTDVSALPDYVPDAPANGSQDAAPSGIPVDEKGAPVFFAVPESFETAKNDGERRQALLNELLENFPDYKEAVCLERAGEAELVFGASRLGVFDRFPNAGQGSSPKGFWAFSSLADSETIALLENGVKRFTLPPEYDYINLWRQAVEASGFSNYNTLGQIAREYEARSQFDKAADAWRLILEQKNVPEAQKELAEAALSQILDPRVAVDASSFVAGMKANIILRHRNAVGAEIVVKRLNLAEPMKMVRTEEFWQEYGELGSLNSLVGALLQRQFAPEKMDPNPERDAKLGELLDSLKGLELVGDEVARYSIKLEPSPKHYDKIMRADFPVDEPGAYLVEITANGGKKDVAVVWLRDVAVLGKRDVVVQDNKATFGVRYAAHDGRSGEPLAEQTLEFFIVNLSRTANSYAYTTNESTKQTDKNGSLFFPADEIHRNQSSEILTLAPKDGVDEASAGQCSFKDFQGIWSLDGDDSSYSTTNISLSGQGTYRPNEKAEFKFIVGSSPFNPPEESAWAGQEVEYRIYTQSWEVVLQRRVKLDQFGAYRCFFKFNSSVSPGFYTVLIAKEFQDSGSADYVQCCRWLGPYPFQIME
jgi:hypothetical protein